jgi:hypothetical protein
MSNPNPQVTRQYKNTKPRNANLETWERDFSHGRTGQYSLPEMEPNWICRSADFGSPYIIYWSSKRQKLGLERKNRKAREIALNQVPMLVAFVLFAQSPCCLHSLKEMSMASVGKRSYEVTLEKWTYTKVEMEDRHTHRHHGNHVSLLFFQLKAGKYV